MLSGNLALTTAAAFAGAAIFVNVAEQPAQLALEHGAALAEWQRSYRRAAVMQAGLALVSALFGAIAWWQTRNIWFAIGAVAILANWPYTLIGIKPTNDRLHAIQPERADSETRRLIETWGRLHAGRSALGVIAITVYLVALI